VAVLVRKASRGALRPHAVGSSSGGPYRCQPVLRAERVPAVAAFFPPGRRRPTDVGCTFLSASCVAHPPALLDRSHRGGGALPVCGDAAAYAAIPVLRERPLAVAARRAAYPG